MTQIDILTELRSAKVVESLKRGQRYGERKVDEYRDISVQFNISENANGSARVKLGGTDVIVGTKFEIGKPYDDSPNEGSISVGVELTPLASPIYEVGPPQPTEVELARVVDRAIRESHCVDLESFCLVEGEQVLSLYIDAYAITQDGNLLDATSMAALAALNTTRLTKVEEGKLLHGEFSGKLKLKNQPLLATFAKVGGTLLLDPDLGEETAMHARFSFGSTEDGTLVAFQKGGSGGMSMEEIQRSIEIGLKVTKENRKKLKE